MLREIEESAVGPGLKLLPVGMDTPQARIMLLAIGLQESGLTQRVQMGDGPARGLWQFERGGVRGVLEHPSTINLAAWACRARKVAPTAQAVWGALESDDVLAAAFARLLLWCDPMRLPDNVQGGWGLYLRTWRPGKPHPDRWSQCWARADDWVSRGIDS